MSTRSQMPVPEKLAAACQKLSNHTQRATIVIAGPIDDVVVESLHATLKEVEQRDADLVIHSYGGYASSAYLIAKLIRDSFGNVRAIVPRYAKSAATLIMLGMDEIVLGPLGELGPIDAQVSEKTDGDIPQHKSALNRFKALENIQEFVAECFHLGASAIAPSGMKASDVANRASEFASSVTEPLLRQLSPQRIGEARRALDEGVEYGTRLLDRYVSTNTNSSRQITKQLAFHYPSHGFVLDAVELKAIGLNARQAEGKERDFLDEIRVHVSPLARVSSPLCALILPDVQEVQREEPKNADSCDETQLEVQANGTLEPKPKAAESDLQHERQPDAQQTENVPVG